MLLIASEKAAISLRAQYVNTPVHKADIANTLCQFRYYLMRTT